MGYKMEKSTVSLNIKRFILVLIIIIDSSNSSEHRNSRFRKSFFDQSDFRDNEDQDFAEDRTRVKRQVTCNFPSINCNNVPNVNKFRTIDGTCNNLGSPFCGSSFTPFLRYVPRDPPGHDFRCPICPRPRDVSVAMNNCPQGPKDGITVMVMQWGQFTDHDLVFTPEESDPGCCEDFQTSIITDTCVPIDVTGDSFYSTCTTPQKCLPFVRSKAADSSCGKDRQTINERTAYLDASMVYGSTPTIANNLRTFNCGKMSVSGSETLSCTAYDICPRSFLPQSGDPLQFFAGDTRVEEQPSLTSIHTLFIRLHNDIANVFSDCGVCDDEFIYQVTRKIVVAIVQQITFNEFLPIVLGNSIMNDPFYGVLDLDESYSYKSSICASAPNVFATAAFRFGHSLIPNEFHLCNGNTIQLAESFNNHGLTLNSNSFPSHFLCGISNQEAMPMDQMIVDAVSNKLFAQGPLFECGSDLYSRNIQRGRDHGIPSYKVWYNKCNTNTINSFEDLYYYEIMPDCVIEELYDLYDGILENVDLFPAGIAEYEVPGGLVGPTFACIIAEHFSDLKFGDRFWFQKSGVFTSSQVYSIRKTLLSSLICLYTNVEEIQPFVMRPHTNYNQPNPLTPCREILKNGVLNDVTTNIWKCNVN